MPFLPFFPYFNAEINHPWAGGAADQPRCTALALGTPAEGARGSDLLILRGKVQHLRLTGSFLWRRRDEDKAISLFLTYR